MDKFFIICVPALLAAGNTWLLVTIFNIDYTNNFILSILLALSALLSSLMTYKQK